MFTHKAYVYQVYKEKSFSKAAEKLFISQPSLSLTIKKVEERLGTRLFDRSTTPIQLTESGQAYISCIERIMDLESGYQHYLHALSELATGNLTIGASNFFTAYILPPHITRFMSQYPQVTVNLIEANTKTLERKLFVGDLDLLVENCLLDEHVYKRHLFYSEQLILAVPAARLIDPVTRRHALTAQDILRDAHKGDQAVALPLSAFAQLPFVLLRPGNDTRDRADSLFGEAGISPGVVLELDQLATAYHMACQGLGATLISDTVVQKTLPGPDVRFFKLDSPCARRDTYLYHKTSKYITRAMQVFCELIGIPL